MDWEQAQLLAKATSAQDIRRKASAPVPVPQDEPIAQPAKVILKGTPKTGPPNAKRHPGGEPGGVSNAATISGKLIKSHKTFHHHYCHKHLDVDHADQWKHCPRRFELSLQLGCASSLRKILILRQTGPFWARLGPRGWFGVDNWQLQVPCRRR